MNDADTTHPPLLTPQPRGGRAALRLAAKSLLLFALAVVTLHAMGKVLWPFEQEYYFERHDSWVRHLPTLPHIVFIGSSTMLYGVSPTIVQQTLSLPTSSVINLGFEARSASIAYAVWNRERAVLSQGKVVVYGLDPWVFSERYYASDDFASLHYSLLQNAYRFFHPDDLTHLNLAGFGGPSMLKVLHGVLSYGSRFQQPVPMTPSDAGGAILTGRPFNFLSPPRSYFEPYPSFGFSDLYLTRLAQLKSEVEISGGTFILLLPPKRKLWAESYRTSCRDIDSDFVRNLNRYLGPTRVFGSFSLVPDSLQGAYFQDDFHLGKDGQRFFSEWIARHLPDAIAQPPQPIHSLSLY